MGTAEAVVLAIKLLAPTIEVIVKYLTRETDEKPDFLLSLPETLQSELELARKLGEVAGKG